MEVGDTRAFHRVVSRGYSSRTARDPKTLSFLAAQDDEEPPRVSHHIIFCDVMLSNAEGERYVQGTAQVALPSRAA